jgi:hypothetical protein
MTFMMSACGVLCSECPAFGAGARSEAERRQTAEAWRRIYAVDEEPERITCGGCLGPDDQLFHTSVRCAARRCCLGKGLASCAACPVRPCALLERAQSTWDEVPDIGANLAQAEFDRYARPYCGHRERLEAARRQGSDPRATGRPGSPHQSLHDPS